MTTTTTTMQPSVGSIPHIKRRIFVGGLPSGVTEEEFKTCFEEFGKVTKVVLMYGKKDQRPRGFGFINFESDEAVEKVTALRFIPLKEMKVEVKRAVPYMGQYERNTNTFETSDPRFAHQSSYNPYYFFNNYFWSSYDLAYYHSYNFPYYYSWFYNPFAWG